MLEKFSYLRIIQLCFLLVILFFDQSFANIVCESNGTTDYAYNLPQRNIISCPSFQKFTFSCHMHHVITIDTLKFSPYKPNPSGECSSDWAHECSDEAYALDYLKNKCSSRKSCTIFSNELRSKTKCILNEVVSISYKCIPTWEVIEVPIKCDLCKNVTFTSGNTPNFGFLHSTWYPHLDPYVSCHSQIQNKPEHVIVLYTVDGYIGPDKILIETYNEYGIHINNVITGNISCNLVMTSNYNVNITIIPQTYQVFNQPQFLLYYYVVPLCDYTVCHKPPVTYLPTYPTMTYPPKTHPPLITYPTPAPTTTTTTTTTTVEQSTYAPPLIADKHKEGNTPTISDAWLAAILGLVYAVLMIFAVLAAIFYRRRRTKNNQITDTHMILSPSMVSTSRVITPSIQQSHISLSEASLRLGSAHVFNNYQSTEHNIYSREQTYEEYDSQRMQNQAFIHQNTLNTGGFNEFDNFSQVIANEDNFGTQGVIMTGHEHRHAQYSEFEQRTNTSEASHMEMNSTIYPYSLRGNTADLSTINSNQTTTQASDASQIGAYRAVEYSRSPDGERVRITNTEDLSEEISSQALKIDRVNTSDLSGYITTNHISTYNHEGSKKTVSLSEESSNFTVKLFPSDLNQNETQEMTMFVDNSQDGMDMSRMFKIDLNK